MNRNILRCGRKLGWSKNFCATLKAPLQKFTQHCLQVKATLVIQSTPKEQQQQLTMPKSKQEKLIGKMAWQRKRRRHQRNETQRMAAAAQETPAGIGGAHETANEDEPPTLVDRLSVRRSERTTTLPPKADRCSRNGLHVANCGGNVHVSVHHCRTTQLGCVTNLRR